MTLFVSVYVSLRMSMSTYKYVCGAFSPEPLNFIIVQSK